MMIVEDLAKRIQKKASLLEDWYWGCLYRFQGATPPIYSSVDLRNSGFKIAVVDTNLFPSGFNNLCETFAKKGSQAFRKFLNTWYPEAQNILIFPEEQTRNLYYWKSVASLRNILSRAGVEVDVGSTSTLLDLPLSVETGEHGVLTIQRANLQGQFLEVSNKRPDLILINNDFSMGIPNYLRDLRQTLLPSPHLGWYRRRKSDHFIYYQRLVEEVSDILEIDPWFLTPLSTVEMDVDLSDEICLRRLQSTADSLLSRIRQKYLQHGIPRKPYLFIKNNSGTYGMGMTHIEKGDQLLSMTRRIRQKLESSKGGRRVSEYLLQEGIPTSDFYQTKPIEPVVYLVGDQVIGIFFRIHQEKNEMENLNSPGMSFACLCLHQLKTPPQERQEIQLTYENRDQLTQVASLLGRIAGLASVLEFHQVTSSTAQIA